MSPDNLRANEDEFRILVDNVVDYAIFKLDMSGYIQTWNAGAERIKGWTAAEAIGRHFSIFYPPEDIAAGKPERELEIAIRDGRVEDEAWRVRKDGSRFWANVVITALHDRSGRLRGFGKVTRDLTERREGELAKDRFIANAAHELRTPLAVIIGLSSHLKNPKAFGDPDFPEMVEALSRQSVRMRTLVNNLLDLTQLHQGRSNISPVDVRLDEAIARAARMLTTPAGRRLEVRVEPVYVWADPLRLDQVITNMLSNAYRYGGDHITIWTQQSGPDEVAFDIADDGPGVPVELAPFLFEPFKRGNSTAAFEGSGLGLALVKGFVESLGGRVEFIGNEPGAHFRITLKKGVGR
ncbi:MAG: PAS domain-containing sensor histidine kinase [Actinomycetota bacterium]